MSAWNAWMCKRPPALALGAALLALAACGDSTFIYDMDVAPPAPTQQDPPANARCPVHPGKDVLANGQRVTFRGKAIAFCSDACVPDFEAMDGPAKAAALAAVGVELPE